MARAGVTARLPRWERRCSGNGRHSDLCWRATVGPPDEELTHCLDTEGTSSAKPVACACCGEELQYTDCDPIGIGVVEHWRLDEEGTDWTV